MIIGDDIIIEEKNIFIKLLYDWKIILVWDFSKIGKMKKKMALS